MCSPHGSPLHYGLPDTTQQHQTHHGYPYPLHLVLVIIIAALACLFSSPTSAADDQRHRQHVCGARGGDQRHCRYHPAFGGHICRDIDHHCQHHAIIGSSPALSSTPKFQHLKQCRNQEKRRRSISCDDVNRSSAACACCRRRAGVPLLKKAVAWGTAVKTTKNQKKLEGQLLPRPRVCAEQVPRGVPRVRSRVFGLTLGIIIPKGIMWGESARREGTPPEIKAHQKISSFQRAYF